MALIVLQMLSEANIYKGRTVAVLVCYATGCSEFSYACVFSITEGCTLKLVLAMRGGPVNTRRGAFPPPTAIFTVESV